MILRGKLYDFVKKVGKFIGPLILVLLPVVNSFVDIGDYSERAIFAFAIALITLIANWAQTVSKKNYEIERSSLDETPEEVGLKPDDMGFDGGEGVPGSELIAAILEDEGIV